MKKKKRTRLSAFLVAACMFASILYPYSPGMQVFATGETTQPNTNAGTTLEEEFEVDGIVYKKVAAGKVQLTKWENASGAITIPGQVSYNNKDYQVVSIGDSVFTSNGSITEVVFPETVTSIGMNAFSWCSALKKASLPSSLATIGSDAFNRCTSLTEASLPSNLTTIGSNAFVYCPLAGTLVLPASVTSIGDFAFQFTEFETIEIQNPDIAYGIGVFSYNDKLAHITLPDSLANLPANFLDHCTNLSEITLPEGLVELKSSVFRSCTSLAKITLPPSVQILRSSIFSGCTGLREVTIPNGVTETSACLFQDCSAGITVNLPDSITVIDPRTFQNTAATVNCTSRQVAVLASGAGVENVYLNGAEFVPPETSFETTDYKFSVIDDENKRVRLGRYKNTAPVEDLQIPETVTSPSSGITYTITEIEKDAFYLRSNITGKIQIPETVTKIGQEAFYGCSAVTGINLPENLESIGFYAFGNCTSLTGTLRIPESCTELPERAFFKCESLAEVIFPETLTQIGLHAFYHCTSLTSLKLPDSLLMMRDSAFEECSGLTSITFPQKLQTIPENAFLGCTALSGVLTLADSTTEIHTGAFGGCDNLSRIHLGNGINVVETGAFPENVMLTTYSPTVQQLLLENTTQTGENLPMLLWDGKSDIPAGTTITLMDPIEISENRTIGENVNLSIIQGAGITIAEDAVLSIGEGANLTTEPGSFIEVNGTLTNNGAISGEATLVKNGTISGNGTMDVEIGSILLTSDMIADIENGTYTGTALTPEPEISITLGEEKLVFEKEIDFTYHYANNTNPGQAQLTVTPTEDGKLHGEPISKEFTIDKANQDSPACHLSFTLNEEQSTYTAEIEALDGAEYSFDGTNWTDNNKKTDCLPATSYTAYIRLKETGTHKASPAAQTQKTSGKANQKAPECSLTFTKNEDGKTYTAEIGEVEGAEYSFDGSHWFQNNKKEDCVPDACVTAFIRMKETDTHNASPFAYISKYIKKADQEAPECSLTFTKNKDGKTYTAEIGEVEGAEYSFDGINWSDSNKKEDCLPETSYTAFIRMKETGTHNASAAAHTTKISPKLEQGTENALEAPKIKKLQATAYKAGIYMDITIQEAADAEKYEVYRIAGTKTTKIGATASGKNTIQDKNPVKSAKYYAVAIGKDGKTTSEPGEAKAVKLADGTKITKISSTTAQIKVTWKKISKAKQYVVYRSTKKSSGYTKIKTVSKNTVSFTDKNVKKGKVYYYKTAVITSTQPSLLSGASKAAKLQPQALGAPAISKLKAKAYHTGIYMDITVKAISGADKYTVYRVVGKNTKKIGTTASKKTTIQDKNPVKAAKYYAVAVSKDGKTKSKAGKTKSVTLAAATKITKVSSTSKGVKITWKKSKAAVNYVLYRSTKKNSGYTKLTMTSKKKLSFIDKKAKKGKKYYYKIAVITKTQSSLLSAASKTARRV